MKVIAYQSAPQGDKPPGIQYADGWTAVGIYQGSPQFEWRVGPSEPLPVHGIPDLIPVDPPAVHQPPSAGVSVCVVGGTLADRFGNPVANPVLVQAETYVDRPSWSHDGRPVWQVTDSGWKLYFDGLSWWLTYHIASGSPAGRWVSDVDPAYSPEAASGWHPISPSTGTPSFQMQLAISSPRSIHAVPVNTPSTPPAITA